MVRIGVQTAFSPSKAEKGKAAVRVVAVRIRSTPSIAASIAAVRGATALRARARSASERAAPKARHCRVGRP